MRASKLQHADAQDLSAASRPHSHTPTCGITWLLPDTSMAVVERRCPSTSTALLPKWPRIVGGAPPPPPPPPPRWALSCDRPCTRSSKAADTWAASAALSSAEADTWTHPGREPPAACGRGGGGGGGSAQAKVMQPQPQGWLEGPCPLHPALSQAGAEPKPSPSSSLPVTSVLVLAMISSSFFSS